jgi:predicted phosphate transport protein (TIGR00153 family)
MPYRDMEEWLKDRRKARVLDLLASHADKVFQVVDELLKITKASMNALDSEVKTVFARQDQMEREADFLRRKVMDEIARSELPPDMKKYFMELSKEVDMVADYAHGAGRILTFLPLSSLKHGIKDKIEQMCVKTRGCALNLRDALEALSSMDYDKAVYLSDEVEKGEEEVDMLFTEARGILLNEEYSNMDPRILLFLSNFLKEIEDTCDRCEDSIDHLRVLLVGLTKPI